MSLRDTDNDASLCDMYVTQLKNVKQIASETGLSEWAVARRLKKHGVEMRVGGPRRRDVSGETHGTWKVIDFALRKNGANYWNCKCKQCGYGAKVSLGNLTDKRGCRCWNYYQNSRGRIVGDLRRSHWKTILQSARSRDIAVTVTPEYLWKLFVEQSGKCAISGLPLTMDAKSRLRNASLDRKDSDRPYEPGNVWWVHKRINQMKWTYPLVEFIELCKSVARYQSENSVNHCVEP